MVEVLLTFLFGAEFDEARIRQVSETGQGEAKTTPGLRSKRLMIDRANCGAVLLYLWDSEDTARDFFSLDRVELITALYGVRPTIQFNSQVKTIVVPRPAADRA
ncbi:MAG: hypothetical protein V4792_04720 [Pseudomonadota bacterium]